MNKSETASAWYQALATLEEQLETEIECESNRLLEGKKEVFFYLKDRQFDEDHLIKLECLSISEAGVYVCQDVEEEFYCADDGMPVHLSLLDIDRKINVYEILVALTALDAEPSNPHIEKQVRKAFKKLEARDKINAHIPAF